MYYSACRIPYNLRMYYSYLHHDKKYSVLTLLAAFLSVPVVFGELYCFNVIIDAALPLFTLHCVRKHCLAVEFAVASHASITVFRLDHPDIYVNLFMMIGWTQGCSQFAHLMLSSQDPCGSSNTIISSRGCLDGTCCCTKRCIYAGHNCL